MKNLDHGRHKQGKLAFRVAVRLATLPVTERRMAWARIKKGKMSHTQAHRHISRTIVKKGLSEHRRGRVPSDDLKIFVRFLSGLETRVASVLDMSDREFNGMIATRTDDARARLLEDVDMAVAGVDRVRLRLKQAIKSLNARS